jgi:MHS family proline/betaine transporter-like MFS transporter
MANVNKSRILAAGAIGNVLEWYDFAAYGYFASTIGAVFFPHQDKVAQVLAAFGIFAMGFLVRPIGGALFGHVGDRIGRRAALNLSIVAMAIPTFLIGVLPGYDRIGLAAPILLTLLRMVQGLSVGGEYTTSIVYLVERAKPERRGLVGATADVAGTIGILGGSASGAILETVMSSADVQSWGWRIPFLFGLALGLIGLVLRHGLPEEVKARKPDHAPLIATFKTHGKVLAQLAGVSVFSAVSFYLMFVYIVSWLQLVDGVSPARALYINTISMALIVPVELGVAWLGDRIGRREIMLAITAISIVVAWPLFWLLHQSESWLILLGQFGFVFIVAGFYGCLPAFMVEVVPHEVRCTATALGYNISLGVIGGLSPLAATWLIERTDNDYSPAFMIMAAAAISFFALLGLRAVSAMRPAEALAT